MLQSKPRAGCNEKIHVAVSFMKWGDIDALTKINRKALVHTLKSFQHYNIYEARQPHDSINYKFPCVSGVGVSGYGAPWSRPIRIENVRGLHRQKEILPQGLGGY